MSFDIWTPMLTSNLNLRNKSLRACNKVTHVELLRGLCCNMLWLIGKSLFLTQYWMRYAIYIPPTTKDLAINLTMVGYGNRQNEITFTQAKNSDLVRALNGNQALVDNQWICRSYSMRHCTALWVSIVTHWAWSSICLFTFSI